MSSYAYNNNIKCVYQAGFNKRVRVSELWSKGFTLEIRPGTVVGVKERSGKSKKQLPTNLKSQAGHYLGSCVFV